MVKKFTVLGLILSFILSFLVLSLGCKKTEQAKEGLKQVEQKKSFTAAKVLSFSFEDGIKGWGPRGKNIKIEQTTQTKHSGNASLRISGTAPTESWNYTTSNKFNLKSGKKYKLTAWMLVESIKDPKYPPFLKCAIEQGSKPAKFLTNYNTKKYDFNKKGEWQAITVDFTTPSATDLYGFIAVEKGTNKVVAMTASIYIDDINLDLIE